MNIFYYFDLMKNILITGAAGNLGKTVTAYLLQEGYTVIATVSSDKERNSLPTDKNLHIHAIDLTDDIAATNMVENIIREHTHIDAVLLLAGGYAGGNILKTSVHEVSEQMNLNFNTAFNIAKPLFGHMIEQGNGRIVFVGSRPALEAAAGKHAVAYALSKSLLFKLADYMNAEAKGKNVVATVIVPSTIDTEANRKSMPDADPSKWVKPQAIAEVLEFLVSEKGNPLRETVLKIYNNA